MMKEHRIWWREFLRARSEALFTSIGRECEIEQENQALKVLGGIKNIANSNQNLDEYFLSVAGMGNIIATFCDRFGISEDQMWKRKITINFPNQRTQDWNNVCKIKEAFNTYDIYFDSTDNGFNILTTMILPQQGTEQVLDVQEIGEEKYQNFVTERIESKSLFWVAINKEKLSTFTNNNKNTSVKVNGEIYCK